MVFDAVSAKKMQTANRKEKKIKKKIDRINQVYPVTGVTEEGYIKTKVGFGEAVFEILNVQKYDLYLMDEHEFDFVTSNNWDLHKLYSYDLKEVYMNFPEDNQRQQEYFKYKIDKATSPAQLEVLNRELAKLEHIEKTYKMRNVYLFVFAPNVTELEERLRYLDRFKHFLGQTPMSIEKKKEILWNLNN